MVAVISPTYERPINSVTATLSMLDKYYRNKFDNYTAELYTTTAFQPVSNVHKYYTPIDINRCITAYQYTDLSSAECDLPSSCGSMYVIQGSLGILQNQKICIGTGACATNQGAGCNNAMSAVTINIPQKFFKPYPCHDNMTCTLNYISDNGYGTEFRMLHDTLQDFWYITSQFCMDNMFKYNTRTNRIELPNTFMYVQKDDQICYSHVYRECTPVGPFANMFDAFKSIPINVDIVINDDIYLDKLKFKHTQIRDMISDNYQAKIDNKGMVYDVTRKKATQYQDCVHIKYVKMSIYSIAERIIGHFISSISVYFNELINNIVVKLEEYANEIYQRAVGCLDKLVQWEVKYLYPFILRMVGLIMKFIYKHITQPTWDYMCSLIGLSNDVTIAQLLVQVKLIETMITFITLSIYGLGFYRSSIITVLIYVIIKIII